MAVFPESMDRLDTSDAERALATLENYIRYMAERTEFAVRNVTKSVTAAGVSSAEIYILVQEQGRALAALQSTLGSVQGQITQLQSDMRTAQDDIGDLNTQTSAIETALLSAQSDILQLQTRLQSAESSITSLSSSLLSAQGDITAVQDRLGVFAETDPTIKSTLDDFEVRIHALEHPAPPEE